MQFVGAGKGPDQIGFMTAPAHLQAQLQAWFPPAVLARLREAGQVAAELGYSLYLIGGGVRDMLLERPFEWDIDLVSETYGVQRLALALQQRWGGQLQRFEQYGTAKLRLGEAEAPLEFDFATARTEHYAYPGANPDVSFSSLEDDLIRRDFSINAMAVGLLPHQFGALIDPFGGWRDLQTRSLRALHARKFLEDPVRGWRAARMSLMPGFVIETQTQVWLLEVMQAGTFDYFFSARMRRELHKLLDKPDPLPYLRQVQSLAVLRCLDPALDWPALEAFLQAMPALAADFGEADAKSVCLLGLLAALSPSAHAQTLAGLELTRPQQQAWQAWQQLGSEPVDWAQLRPSQIHARLRSVPAEALWAICAAAPGSALAVAVLAYWRTLRFIRPGVSGTIIKEWLPPGPQIRRILDALLVAQLDGLIESEEQALAWARRLADEVGQDSASSPAAQLNNGPQDLKDGLNDTYAAEL